jgi:rhomboid protease GluP
MSPDTPAAPFRADVSVPVDFHLFARMEYNADLKGRGTFAMQRDPPAYRFTGLRRQFLSGKRVELDFAPADILNVQVDGRKVRFATTKGNSGRLTGGFVFYCRNAAGAEEAAGLLPKVSDPDFVAGREVLAVKRDFERKLRQLPGAGNPYLSVTGVIIALNVAVFLAMAGFLGAGWLETTDLTPYILYGANNAAATTDGQWWRLITSMFMHYGALHLALNMWALFQSGRLVERLQGRALYATTYLASGVGGGFLSLAWHGNKIWSAGASGAIFGVYGALLGYMLREKEALPKPVLRPLVRSTLTFAGYNLFYGLIHPGIDNAAHIGGLLTGLVLGWLTAPPLDLGNRSSLLGRRLAIAAAAIAVMVVAGVEAAPRYDYSVTDELAWADAVKPFVAEDAALEAGQNAALDAWVRTRRNGADFRRMIEDKMVPLYGTFARTIDSLHLSPGRLTARRRKAFSEFARLRLDAYGHLVAAVEQNDPQELEAYNQLNEKASKVLQSFQDSQKAAR